MSSTIPPIGKGGTKNILQTPKEDTLTHQLKKEESKQEDTPLLSTKWIKKLLPSWA